MPTTPLEKMSEDWADKKKCTELKFIKKNLQKKQLF